MYKIPYNFAYYVRIGRIIIMMVLMLNIGNIILEEYITKDIPFFVRNSTIYFTNNNKTTYKSCNDVWSCSKFIYDAIYQELNTTVAILPGNNYYRTKSCPELIFKLWISLIKKPTILEIISIIWIIVLILNTINVLLLFSQKNLIICSKIIGIIMCFLLEIWLFWENLTVFPILSVTICIIIQTIDLYYIKLKN